MNNNVIIKLNHKFEKQNSLEGKRIYEQTPGISNRFRSGWRRDQCHGRRCLLCRSKSERTIAQELIRYSIPYLYECKTLIGNMIMYPDFTVRNRRHGKQYIWEHNGRMTDESYFGSAMYRERIYLQNNYIPGVNLIMTYETEACPLNISTIDQMIETYLIWWWLQGAAY